MTYQELLPALLHSVIIGAVPILVGFIVNWILTGSKKLKETTKNERIRNAIDTVTNLVSDIVMYVSQTYVDALKKEGTFTKEKQLEALNMAYDRALEMIDERSKDVIESVFGDFGTYLLTLIEATVRKQKPPEQPTPPAEPTEE